MKDLYQKRKIKTKTTKMKKLLILLSVVFITTSCKKSISLQEEEESSRIALAPVVDSRFADGFKEEIFSPLAHPYGEPTVITTPDQIDIWFGGPTGYMYSSSTDGINYTTPVSTDIPSGMFRGHIFQIGSIYYMYVTGNTDMTVYLYTSTDKIHFTPQGQVLTISTGNQWDASHIGNTFVWVEGTTWYMLYEAYGPSSTWQIGLATSNDGLNWVRDSKNPVLSVLGAGNPELARLGSTILKYNGKYYMYYHVQPDVYRANSTDLHKWFLEGKIDGNQHTPTYNNINNYGDATLGEFKGKTYLWYGPTNQVNDALINVAVDNRSFSTMLSLTPSVKGKK